MIKPLCESDYKGLLPMHCMDCTHSRYNIDVMLEVNSEDVQELIEVLCEIHMEVEQGEYSDGEPHRPSCIDSLIDQLIKYVEENNDDGEFCESCQTYHHDDEPCPPGAY